MKTELIYRGHRFQCVSSELVGDFLHLHKEVELLFVRNGSMKMTINTQEHLLEQGDFVVIFPYTIHKAEKTGDLNYLLCTFDVDILPFFSSLFSNYVVVGSPVVKLDNLPEEVSFCLEQILNRPELQRENNITFGYLTVILEHLIQNLHLCEGNSNQDWLFGVVSYLNDNFRSTIRLDAMATELGRNKYFLSRNFKKGIGCSMEQYVNYLRIDYAKNLLLFTQDAITDIAFESGFENISTFYRVFKDLGYGTPKEFRQRKI